MNGVATRPRLAASVRLRWDKVRETHVLLYPEGALVLNETAASVLELCDGTRALDEIVATLAERFDGADVRPDVERLLTAVGERGLVVDGDS